MPYRNVWLTLASITIAAGTTCLMGCGSSTPPQQQRVTAPETQSATMPTGPMPTETTGGATSNLPPTPAQPTPTPTPSMPEQHEQMQQQQQPPPQATIGDEHVIGILLAANAGQMEQAKLAATHSKNAKVKAYADRMMKDHSAVAKETNQLVQRLHITIAETPFSQRLVQDSRQELDTLRGKHGADFDKEYMGAQVRQHRELLDSLDNQLIPNAKSPEVKNQLMQERSKVEQHLREAEEIHRSVGTSQ